MLIIALTILSLLTSEVLYPTRLPRAGERGPLFEFGQNIYPQHRGFASVAVDHLDLKHECISIATEIVSYAPTNNLTVEAKFPWIRRKKDIAGKHYNTGVGDIGIQVEYAPYNYQTKTFVRQVTVVGALYFPTSRPDETGIESLLLLDRSAYTPFIGATFSTITPQWYYFLSAGALLPSNHKYHHYGMTTLYQWGVGRTMIAGEIFYVMALLQFSGVSLCQEKLHGITKPNTGRNTAYLGPVIRGAYKKLLGQFGFQKVLYERVKGMQNKSFIRLAAVVNFGHDF